MRYERTDSFKADYKRLATREQQMFREVVPAFSDAADAFILGQQPWPKGLRVKDVQGTKSIYEMTWSFSGPDGRATWEWASIIETKGRKTVQHPAVRWRRIGGHEIFANP